MFHDSLKIVSNAGTGLIPLSGDSPYPQALTSGAALSFNAQVGKAEPATLNITNGSIDTHVIDSTSTASSVFLYLVWIGLSASILATLSGAKESPTGIAGRPGRLYRV